MLSRLVRPTLQGVGQVNALASLQTVQLPNVVTRCVTTTSGNKSGSKIQEGPERDLVNFPRPVRLEYPGAVRFGFIPDEWFQFFYPKTGVTGPYVFGFGFLTYVLSKEIWVLEHEFWGGVSLFAMVIYAVKKFGPSMSQYLEKEQKAYIDSLNENKLNDIQACKDGIEAEKLEQARAEASKQLFDIKRENVGLQLEAEYRQRLMHVYEEVKKRLDYQVALTDVERNIEQRHMVNWIVGQVKKSISAESEAENLKKCISDLKALASVAKV